MKKRETTPSAPSPESGSGLFRPLPMARSFRERTGFTSELKADLKVARRLSRLLGESRGGEGEAGVSAARLHALALIEEVLRRLVERYIEEANPQLLSSLEAWLEPEAASWQDVVRGHVRELPPAQVFTRAQRAPRRQAEQSYLAGESGGIPHHRLELMQVILLWLAVHNPAYRPFAELFDDSALQVETGYRERVARLRVFFEYEPHFGPDDQNLLDLLAAPALVSPDSLFGQLEYIRLRWGGLLGDMLDRLLRGGDLIREEEKPRIGGAGAARVLDYRGLEAAGERYSPDRDWMPGLVLMAKSCLVWLSQLSRTYGRPVSRLDEIPEEEIVRLAGWGITGLWLIGIWERSAASRTIKRSCGNPEAEASAYSLRAYRVAEALGGPEALHALSERCRRHGIRLASDMVPNHTGLDSPWLAEHPDWYINLPDSPFPAYTFQGQDLSNDSRFSAVLEDHYYDRSDAAVVFRSDNRINQTVHYVYHGNDGTHLPWNDTAQLNYLVPELREAVIRTILEVAKQFPIIRFDAAMTLTRRHYQRLWFPPPGEGGDIPSRAEHGLSREDFDRAMPVEFWREVVDRVAAEAPDTLLLAEAFWLMEGYFVRNLGMHRVYNSAFMNMLKMEENRNYRELVKNTLSYDPRILARYVNFMNNPDEETAVAQFGRQEKYFGVCLLMATLPGLPMFGHGQVEGLEEKYGMEYARAYRDEEPDEELVRRHEREIFPLLARRTLFAGVENFRFYDLVAPGPASDAHAEVDENVYAYSNRDASGCALVLFNNRYGEARGRIRTSVPFAAEPGENRGLRREELSEALNLPASEGEYIVFRELFSGLEYFRPAAELSERGLEIKLGAYQYQVFTDFHRAEGDPRQWTELAKKLEGRGVPDLQEEMENLRLRPLHTALAELLSGSAAEPGLTAAQLAADAERGAAHLRELAPNHLPAAGPDRHPLLERMLTMPVVRGETGFPEGLLVPLLLLTSLLGMGEQPPGEAAAALRLGPVLMQTWRDSGLSAEEAARLWQLLLILLELAGALTSGALTSGALDLRELLGREDIRSYLHVHAYREVLYFQKEAFTDLLAAVVALGALAGEEEALRPPREACMAMAERAGYRLDVLMETADG